MPFINNRIDAKCGAKVLFVPSDNIVTVVSDPNIERFKCDGCSFQVNYLTGRITLLSSDENRKCLLDKAPVSMR